MTTTQQELRFNGADYTPRLDQNRLTGQIRRIYSLMQDQQWRTFDQIAEKTHDPTTSISAQLRNLRKQRFGGHTVNRRRVDGDPTSGLHEYQLIPNPRSGTLLDET